MATLQERLRDLPVETRQGDVAPCLHIPAPLLKGPDELTVREVAERFAVSLGVVYYWIDQLFASIFLPIKSSYLKSTTIPHTKHPADASRSLP